MAINGSTLKAFRESKNLSQAGLAKLIRCDPATISNLENDRTNIGPTTLAKYRKAGFRQPVGRPPSNGAIKEDPTMPPLVASALQVLEQNAPHLLHTDDANTALLRGVHHRLLVLEQVTEQRLKDIRVEQEAGFNRLEAQLNRLEAMMTAAMEDPAQEPELQNTDRGPDDPRE